MSYRSVRLEWVAEALVTDVPRRGRGTRTQERVPAGRAWRGVAPEPGWARMSPSPAETPILTWASRAGKELLPLF